MRRLIVPFALILGLSTALADDWEVRQKVAANFTDATDSIVMAIENRGLVVNYTSHIADMLNRTGGDIGASRR